MSMLDDPTLRDAPTIHGYRVLEPCVLLDTLGKGGMGTVYRGWHLNLNVQAAVKCLHNLGSDAASVARFRAEASLLASLSHASLVRVFDVRQLRGLHYIVMEFVDGETAADRVDRLGPLPVADAVRITQLAAQGLAAAHAKGIVHRDIKPDNILIARTGEVKVADLGIAKFAHHDDALATHSQMLMGTPHYMAPEQWQGAKLATPRSDVYALGVTLYTLVTGAIPFHADSLMGIAELACKQGLPDPRTLCDTLPEPVANLIIESTAIHPQGRPADAAALAQRLAALLATLSQPAQLADDSVATRIAGTLRPDDADLDAIRKTLSNPQAEGSTFPGTLVQPDDGPTPRRSRLVPALIGVGILAAGVGVLGVTSGWFAGPPAQTQPGHPADEPRPGVTPINRTVQDQPSPVSTDDPAALLDRALADHDWAQAAHLLTLPSLTQALERDDLRTKITALSTGLSKTIELTPAQWPAMRKSVIALTPDWPADLAPILAQGLATEPPTLARVTTFLDAMKSARGEPAQLGGILREQTTPLVQSVELTQQDWNTPAIRELLDKAPSDAVGTLYVQGLARFGSVEDSSILVTFADRLATLIDNDALQPYQAHADATRLVARFQARSPEPDWYTPQVAGALRSLAALRDADDRPCLAAATLELVGRAQTIEPTDPAIPALITALADHQDPDHGLTPNQQHDLAQAVLSRVWAQAPRPTTGWFPALIGPLQTLADDPINAPHASALLAEHLTSELAQPIPLDPATFARWQLDLSRAQDASLILADEAEASIARVMATIRDQHHSDHSARFPATMYAFDEDPEELIVVPEAARPTLQALADTGSPAARLTLFEASVWYQLTTSSAMSDMLVARSDQSLQELYKLIDGLTQPRAYLYQGEVLMMWAKLDLPWQGEARLARALRAFQSIIDQASDGPTVALAHVRIGQLWRTSSILKEQEPNQSFRDTKAMDHFTQAVAADPESRRARFYHTWGLVDGQEQNRGMRALAAERWPQAIIWLKRKGD